MPIKLFIPDLARFAAGLPRLPALETLLTRADSRPAPEGSMHDLLAAVFKLPPASLTMAPLSYLADTGQRGDGFWLRADPVHLVADRDQLVMSALATLEVRAEEAQALADTFNRMYAEEGFVLETPSPLRWYLHTPKDMTCVTHDPVQVAGGPIFDFMPSGPDAPFLKQLMNEMQMLFHEHAVNQAREAAGKPLINTAWLWGGGRLPGVAAAGPQQVATNMPLVHGLALFAGSVCRQWPDVSEVIGSGQTGLIAVQVEQAGEMATIEARIVQPLLDALRKGAAEVLDIYPGGDRVYQVNRSMLHRFWRQRRPLSVIQGRG
ncbi:MAG: hypothetical protein ACRETO_12250 [Gammaproteobacteria bacterium]